MEDIAHQYTMPTLSNATLCLDIQPTLLASSPEAPDQQDQDDKSESSEWTILLEQQLPVDPDGRPFILCRVFSQSTAHISHLLQAVSSVQQVLDVLCHHLRHVFQLVVQSTQVVRGAAILVRLLRALNEAFELAVLVWSKLRIEVILAFVRGLELSADVFEIGKRKFLWVRFLGDGDVAEGVVEDVTGARASISASQGKACCC